MRPCCARETWSKFSAHVTGMPSSWVRTNSVAKPRTVLVTGTTINSFRFPITSLRVRIITGRRLSGSRNVYHRISPRLTQILPTFGVPRERFFIAGEFVSPGRSHSVHGGVALRCCLDKMHQPIALARRQTRDQR